MSNRTTVSTPPEVVAADGASRDGRSIPDLIREITLEGQTLVRKEVELARTEMQEKVSIYQENAAKIGIGAGIALLGAVYVLWAVNMGITALFAQFMDAEVAVWLAPLVLGAVLAAVGLSMAKGAGERIRREGIAPQRTIESLEKDKNLVKEEVRR